MGAPKCTSEYTSTRRCPVGSMPTQNPRGERRRAALLEAAKAVFVEQGYAGATLDDVIAQAGGSRATLYKQFGGKEGLFAAVIAEICAEIVAPLDDDVGDRQTEGCAACLRSIVHGGTDGAGGSRALSRFDRRGRAIPGACRGGLSLGAGRCGRAARHPSAPLDRRGARSLSQTPNWRRGSSSKWSKAICIFAPCCGSIPFRRKRRSMTACGRGAPVSPRALPYI